MKERWLVGLLTAVAAVALLVGCGTAGSASGGGKYSIEAKTYPMRIQLESTKDPESTEINLYFVDGGDIPYVALSEYMPFVGGIYEDADLEIPAATYEITYPVANHTLVSRTDNSSSMDIDAAADTIEFVGLDYFTATPGSTLFLSAVTIGERGRGGVSNLLQDSGASYTRAGDALVTFDLSEYDIDLIEQDGECYVPLQTVNDLLVSQNYVYVVWTREEVLASSYSSPLIDEMYNAPTGEMSEGFANFNYNELRFLLDTFYGLKEEHGIDNFGDYFSETGLLEDLAGTDPAKFDGAIRILTMKYFDDGHSSLAKNSYLAGEPDPDKKIEDAITLFEDLGTSTDALIWATARFKGVRAEYYPDHPELDDLQAAAMPWFYEEVGDTAIITFDMFSVAKKDYYTGADLTNPNDTIELIAYAHSQITRENSPIKNVVVDLSCNGGGTADAAVYLLAWLSSNGMARMALRNPLTGAQSVAMYEADINLDGEFDPDDYLDGDINRYVLMSSSSFSCGNLVPAILKGSPNVTLLGQTSGGGACVVRPCTSASGTIFTISSPKQICSVKNGSLYHVDQGVDPDFVLSNLETFYNREKLVEYIHQLP